MNYYYELPNDIIVKIENIVKEEDLTLWKQNIYYINKIINDSYGRELTAENPYKSHYHNYREAIEGGENIELWRIILKLIHMYPFVLIL